MNERSVNEQITFWWKGFHMIILVVIMKKNRIVVKSRIVIINL